KRRENKNPAACGERTPPPGETEAGGPSREELERWAGGHDPILARIGRAALAQLGEQTTVVVDAPAQPANVAASALLFDAPPAPFVAIPAESVVVAAPPDVAREPAIVAAPVV